MVSFKHAPGGVTCAYSYVGVSPVSDCDVFPFIFALFSESFLRHYYNLSFALFNNLLYSTLFLLYEVRVCFSTIATSVSVVSRSLAPYGNRPEGAPLNSDDSSE